MGIRIAAQRLYNQRITRLGPPGPAKMVAWLGAVQAQEYGPAKWSLGLRLPPGVTDAAIERAIDRGQILRTHILRPTWHFVTPADIRWMLDLTAPEVHRRMCTYDRQLGLDAPVMTRATGIIERALGDAGHLTRGELGAHLGRAGLPGKSTHLAHIAMHAELEGVICSGPRRGQQLTYALLAERAPKAKILPREQALAELTRRYFRSHGPATVRDFAWWSGLKSADAKRGLEMNRAKSVEVDRIKYWCIGRAWNRRSMRRTTVHLLPVYDEYLVAYRDRQAVPHTLYSSWGLNVRHALIIDGQTAGTWRTTAGSGLVTLKVETSRSLTAGERRALDRVAERYQRFLGVPVSLSVI
ncbi:MAG TPA: winged helix DNA-binding domain-containing protein [Gemmatimonadales bacterium]|nr:winged helix DNA-binding domain-containing protein [Gemmatimonadales bacterium]